MTFYLHDLKKEITILREKSNVKEVIGVSEVNSESNCYMSSDIKEVNSQKKNVKLAKNDSLISFPSKIEEIENNARFQNLVP